MNERKLGAYLIAIAALIVAAAILISWRKCPDAIGKDEHKSRRKPAEVSELEFKEPPLGKRPERIPEDKVVERYPPGKQVKSVAFLHVTGQGTNKSWGIEQKSHFFHQYKFAAITTVKENRKTSVVFAVDVVESVQLEAVSLDRSVQLSMPKLGFPMNQFVDWTDRVLTMWPRYKGAKKLVELLNTLDPGLKRTLTSFVNLLEKSGIHLDPSNSLIKGEVEKFSGMQFEVNYVSGLGCMSIKVLQGKTLPDDFLEQLALNLTVMADYFVSRAAEKKVGATDTLNMRDVAGLMSFGQEVDVSGSVDVKRLPDKPSGDEKLQILGIEGGAVELRESGNDEEAVRHATVRPRSGGSVWYSSGQNCVRRAEVEWDGNLNWVSRGSLLFNWDNVHSLTVKTIYEAEVVGPNSKGKNP